MVKNLKVNIIILLYIEMISSEIIDENIKPKMNNNDNFGSMNLED